MIVAAAIRTSSGRVYALPAPARHHDILRRLIPPGPGQEQGFIDADQGFVDRKTARAIVVHEGQPLAPHQRSGLPRREPDHPKELFSEDLW